MSLPGLVHLARHPDDAAPEWRWFWQRLAVAWVPALDPWIGVGIGGTSRPTLSGSNLPIVRGGPDGEVEIWRNLITVPVTCPPGHLNSGITIVDFSRAVARGNRTPDWALKSGSIRAGIYMGSGTGTIERLLEPPGAYDATGLSFALHLPSVTIASIANGDQRYYHNLTAGTSRTTSYSPSWGTDTAYTIGTTDAALEWYHPIKASAVLIGPSTVHDVAKIDEAMRSLAPFRWRRRRTFFVPSGGATNYDQSAAGALSFAGALSRTTSRATAGALLFSGALVRDTTRAIAASLSPTGALQRAMSRGVAGSLSPSGALVTGLAYNRAVSGAMTPTGALVAEATRGVTGELSFQATVARTMARSVAGTLSFAGAVQANLAVSKATAGVLSFGGDLVTQYNPPPVGGGGALQRTQD